MEKVWNADFLYFNKGVKISLEFRTEKLQSGHKISDFIDQKFPLQNQFLGYFPPVLGREKRSQEIPFSAWKISLPLNFGRVFNFSA